MVGTRLRAFAHGANFARHGGNLSSALLTLAYPDGSSAYPFDHPASGDTPSVVGRREITMMKTIKGPAIFLAQFAGDTPPFNSLDAIAGWAAKLGFKGVQIPAWDARLFDLARAADSKAYCDDIHAALAKHG